MIVYKYNKLKIIGVKVDHAVSKVKVNHAAQNAKFNVSLTYSFDHKGSIKE